MYSRTVDLSHGRNFRIVIGRILTEVTINQGAFCFTCSVSARPVHSDQCGIECDNCLQWCHAACSDVDNHQYQEMIEREIYSWSCPSCYCCSCLFNVTSVNFSMDSIDSVSTSESSITAWSSSCFRRFGNYLIATKNRPS